MLPSLGRLGHIGRATAAHGGENDNRLGLKGLPDALLEVMFSGIGVPLMLVRYNREEDKMAYIRLPDPEKHTLDDEFFLNANYPFAEILAGVIKISGYDKNTSITQFVDVKPYNDEPLPEELDKTDEANYGNDDGPQIRYDVIEMARQAVEFSQDGTPSGDFFQIGRPQIVFNSFPSFKSHTAIVLNVDFLSY